MKTINLPILNGANTPVVANAAANPNTAVVPSAIAIAHEPPLTISIFLNLTLS